MATAAQLSANRANAKHSTGPVTPAGKARASQNSSTLGLFSASAFIRPEEQEIYHAFRTEWVDRLVPDGPIEKALVAELVQAAWRLRRCVLLESTSPHVGQSEDLDRMQASIDRARVSAQRTMHRNLNELRRIQTERQMRDVAPYGYQAHAEFGVASVERIEHFVQQLKESYPLSALERSPSMERDEIAKQSQSAASPQPHSAERTQLETQPMPATPDPRAPAVLIPRGAPCPCGSGEKYKRCCGRSAPPVLQRAA